MSKNPSRGTTPQVQKELLWKDMDNDEARLSFEELINHRSSLLQKEIGSAVNSAMKALSRSVKNMEAELVELRTENETLQASARQASERRSSPGSNGVNEHKAEMLSVVPAPCRPKSTERTPRPPSEDDGTIVQDLTHISDDADVNSVNSNYIQDVGSHIDDNESVEQIAVSVGPFAPANGPVQVWRSDTKFGDADSCTSVKSRDEHEVLPVWAYKKGYKRSMVLRSQVTLRQALASEGDDSEGNQKDWYRNGNNKGSLYSDQELGRMDSERRRRSRCVLHPNSFFRGVWDFSSLFLVVYDMVVIPLQLFEPPENALSIMMAWVTRCFWTADMPMSCLTGLIMPDGSSQMDLWFITKRYLKTWFALDAFIVSIDWIELIWAAGGSLAYARIGKASRIFRIIRLLRLLRIVRIREVIKVIIERLRSERLIIMAHILKMTCIIGGVAHVMACIWYGLGKESLGDNAVESWINIHLKPTFSLGYRYFASLHWAISQFSGGMDEIRPQNQVERIYAIVCFVIGFIIAAVFVSSVTSSMTQLHLLTTHQSKQFLVLRRFLTEHSISNKLSLRVLRSAAHSLAEQQRFVPEANVEMLTYVSHALRTHLHFEMFAPHFAQHPWFARYCEECPHVMRKVSHAGTSLIFCTHGDAIFHAGEMPEDPKFYILLSGRMRYTMPNDTVTTVDENNWLAEPTLWTRWTHRGSLVAWSDCRLLMLDAQRFQSIVSQFDHDEFDPKMYAAEFVEYLNSVGVEASDLPFANDALTANYCVKQENIMQQAMPGMIRNLRKSLRSTKTALLGES